MSTSSPKTQKYPAIRTEQEDIIRNYTRVAAIVEFPDPIDTHIGKIDMLDMAATPIKVEGKDWVVLGSLADLNQQEFEQVRLGVAEHARQLLLTAYKH